MGINVIHRFSIKPNDLTFHQTILIAFSNMSFFGCSFFGWSFFGRCLFVFWGITLSIYVPSLSGDRVRERRRHGIVTLQATRWWIIAEKELYVVRLLGVNPVRAFFKCFHIFVVHLAPGAIVSWNTTLNFYWSFFWLVPFCVLQPHLLLFWMCSKLEHRCGEGSQKACQDYITSICVRRWCWKSPACW